MKRRLMVLFVSLVLTLTAAAPGCARQAPEPSPEPAPTPSEQPTQEPEPGVEAQLVRLYLVRAETIGVAGREVEPKGDGTEALALAAMEALVVGPTAEEREFGLSTAIPEGTRVLGLEIADGVATVDLSEEFGSGGGSLSMQMRAAQVVCTLTQFADAKEVAFEIEGSPIEALGGEGVMVGPSVDRADFEDMLPAILVESPYPGQEITSPVVVSGSSNTFEATHQLNITDPEGLVVAEQLVTATSGTGTRGTWSVQVDFDTQRSGLGEVIAFELSAKDGSRINIVEVPVRMQE